MADRPDRAQVAAAPPQDVQTAFKLWVAIVVLGVISLVPTWFIRDELAALAGMAPPELPAELTSEQTLGAVIFAVAFGVVFISLVVGIELLVVHKMRVGRNWARVVLTVVGAASLAAGLINVDGTLAPLDFGPFGVLSALISVVQIALYAVAIYFMWRPASATYFSGPR